MKKGIDVKIIDGNIGIPVRPFNKPFNAKEIAKWRLAYDNAMMNQHPVEDIEYTEVTDSHSLPELTPEFSNQLLEYNKLHSHDVLFNQPEHIAFLGHELNSK